MTSENIYKYIKILAVIGLILGSYLFYNYVNKPANTLCSINATINCDAVTTGELSLFLGIPTALIGLTGYMFIMLFAWFKKPALVLAVAMFGMIFCLRLTILEIFYLKVYCPVCLMCQLDMLLVTILGFKLFLKKDK